LDKMNFLIFFKDFFIIIYNLYIDLFFYFFIFYFLIIVASVYFNFFSFLINDEIESEMKNFFNLFFNFKKLIFILPVFFISYFSILYFILIGFFIFLFYFFKFIYKIYFKKSVFLINYRILNGSFINSLNINWIKNFFNIFLLIYYLYIESVFTIVFNKFYDLFKIILKENKKKINFLTIKNINKIVFLRCFKFIFFIPFKTIVISNKLIDIFYYNVFIRSYQIYNIYNILLYILFDSYYKLFLSEKNNAQKKKIFINEFNDIQFNPFDKINKSSSLINKLSNCSKNSFEFNENSNICVGVEKNQKLINKFIKNDYNKLKENIHVKHPIWQPKFYEKNDLYNNRYNNQSSSKLMYFLDEKKQIQKIDAVLKYKGVHKLDSNYFYHRTITKEDVIDSKPLDTQFIINIANNPNIKNAFMESFLYSLQKPCLYQYKDGTISQKNIILEKDILNDWQYFDDNSKNFLESYNILKEQFENDCGYNIGENYYLDRIFNKSIVYNNPELLENLFNFYKNNPDFKNLNFEKLNEFFNSLNNNFDIDDFNF